MKLSRITFYSAYTEVYDWSLEFVWPANPETLRSSVLVNFTGTGEAGTVISENLKDNGDGEGQGDSFFGGVKSLVWV